MMNFCKYGDTLYNFDKFIGVEVVDYSDDVSDSIGVLFRFENDYLKSSEDENTPYTFIVWFSDRDLHFRGEIKRADIEEVYEDNIHNVLRSLASEFVGKLKDEIIDMYEDGSYTVDVGLIKYNVLKEVKTTVKENK